MLPLFGKLLANVDENWTVSVASDFSHLKILHHITTERTESTVYYISYFLSNRTFHIRRTTRKYFGYNSARCFLYSLQYTGGLRHSLQWDPVKIRFVWKHSSKSHTKLGIRQRRWLRLTTYGIYICPWFRVSPLCPSSCLSSCYVLCIWCKYFTYTYIEKKMFKNVWK